jgi:repressor LexA
MEKLTILQKNVFTFICDFVKDAGFPPSYSEIAKHFSFKSDGTVRTYLEHLEKKGYIQRLGKARGIKILFPFAESIPILGAIAAGNPIDAIEDYIGTISDIASLHYQNDRFALKVKGESMIEAGIQDGDLAIIQRNTTIKNGDIAAVLIEDEATLKTIYFEQDIIRLQPENRSYTPITLKKGTFNARFLGKYIALVREV